MSETVILGIAEEACHFTGCHMSTSTFENRRLRLNVAMDRDGTIDLEEDSLSVRALWLCSSKHANRVFDLPKTEEHHLVSYAIGARLC